MLQECRRACPGARLAVNITAQQGSSILCSCWEDVDDMTPPALHAQLCACIAPFSTEQDNEYRACCNLSKRYWSASHRMRLPQMQTTKLGISYSTGIAQSMRICLQRAACSSFMPS